MIVQSIVDFAVPVAGGMRMGIIARLAIASINLVLAAARSTIPLLVRHRPQSGSYDSNDDKHEPAL